MLRTLNHLGRQILRGLSFQFLAFVTTFQSIRNMFKISVILLILTMQQRHLVYSCLICHALDLRGIKIVALNVTCPNIMIHDMSHFVEIGKGTNGYQKRY